MKRDGWTIPIPFSHELLIDNFAGGGGTSTGLEQAFGRPVDIAINHDAEALAMHAANHPHTKHLCESVWEVGPINVTGNQPVGLVWLSPDCKHFSKAKGGKPVEKKIRGLAWVALRWAAKCKPRVIMLENVEEFKTWGPLMVDAEGNAKPDPAKKGKTFDSFVRQLRGHGYEVDWRELRAYQHWRRSGGPTLPDPREIGETIDAAIVMIAEQAARIAELESASAAQGEPVGYQKRYFRSPEVTKHFSDQSPENVGWTRWHECSKTVFYTIKSKPVEDYEIRALYAAPPSPNSDARNQALEDAAQRVGDLSALVMRLVRQLNKAAPANDLPNIAMDYMRRIDAVPLPP